MNSGLSKTSKNFAAALILILFVVHQDFWNWGVTQRTVGGLPRGFVFQVGLSIAAAFVWWIIAMTAWPRDEWAETHTEEGLHKLNQTKPDQPKSDQTKLDRTKTPSENPWGQA